MRASSSARCAYTLRPERERGTTAARQQATRSERDSGVSNSETKKKSKDLAGNARAGGVCARDAPAEFAAVGAEEEAVAGRQRHARRKRELEPAHAVAIERRDGGRRDKLGVVKVAAERRVVHQLGNEQIGTHQRRQHCEQPPDRHCCALQSRVLVGARPTHSFVREPGSSKRAAAFAARSRECSLQQFETEN